MDWHPHETKTSRLQVNEHLTPARGTAGYVNAPELCHVCLVPFIGQPVTLDACGVTVRMPEFWAIRTEILATTDRQIHTGNFTSGSGQWTKAEYWQGPELVPVTIVVPAPTALSNLPGWTFLPTSATADRGVFATQNQFEFSTSGTANIAIACETLSDRKRIYMRFHYSQLVRIEFETNPANAVVCTGTVNSLATGQVAGPTSTWDTVNASATPVILTWDVLNSDPQELDLTELTVDASASQTSTASTTLEMGSCMNGTPTPMSLPKQTLTSTYEISTQGTFVPV